MKKTFRIIIMTLAALASVSCIGPKGDPGRDGKDGLITSVNNITIRVDRKNWEYSGLSSNNYFVATVDMPEITRSVFDGGLVKMYRIFNYGTSQVSQAEMPYSNHVEEYVGGDWVFYNEKVDYVFQVGKIYIYFQVSDFDYEIDETYVPEAMDFRCVIMN